jgi:ssDNA-binding Zn-finger/Zn-ribbon topoisomerase 1
VEQGELFDIQNSIDRTEGTSVCVKCNIEKPLRSFSFREPKVGKSYRSECKKCSGLKNKLREDLAKKHPKPEVTDYSCPICKKSEVELKSNNRWNDRSVWALDHNHDSKTFRGWLCNNCNIGLGKFYDKVENLERAITYLREHK